MITMTAAVFMILDNFDGVFVYDDDDDDDACLTLHHIHRI